MLGHGGGLAVEVADGGVKAAHLVKILLGAEHTVGLVRGESRLLCHGGGVVDIGVLSLAQGQGSRRQVLQVGVCVGSKYVFLRLPLGINDVVFRCKVSVALSLLLRVAIGVLRCI